MEIQGATTCAERSKVAPASPFAQVEAEAQAQAQAQAPLSSKGTFKPQT